mgnify:CR=1 FL=1
MDTSTSASEHLRAGLLHRLRPIAAGRPGMNGRGHHLFSYCTLDRERLASIRMPHSVIAIVLHGMKEIWLGEAVTQVSAGGVFVLPGGVPLDVVNIPGPAGLYESLLIEVAVLPDGVPPLTPSERTERAGAAFRVPLTPDLCQALIHAATAIADDASADVLKTLRLTEVLTLLRGVPAARPLFRRTLEDDVSWLVSHAPAETWTVKRAAEALRIGASTLRRRLAAEGHSFRALVRQARLKTARRMLDNGATSLAAAEAAGYASRSHFARRYRQTFGVTPSGR